MSPPATEPLFFETPGYFRAWLQRNSDSGTELLVGFHKRGSGRPSITWPEAVDEALCVGWIDGVRKRIDDHCYQIRFTPRKTSSIWSAINIERVKILIAEGRMTPAGLAAFDRRTDKKSRIYSYEQPAIIVLTPEEDKTFRAQPAAWAFFGNQAPSYRKTALWWIISAKQATTREKRLAKLIAASASNQRL